MMFKDEYKTLLTCIRSLKCKLNKVHINGKNWVYTTEASVIRDAQLLNRLSSKDVEAKKASSVKKISTPEFSSLKNREFESKLLQAKTEDFNKFQPFNIESSTSKSLNQCPIVFVRLCPSEEEIVKAKTYSDKAGETLRIIQEHIGWDEKLIFKTYLCKYPMEYIPENSKEISLWKKRFLDDIKPLKPKIILCWGERVSNILSSMNHPIEELFKKNQKDHYGHNLFFFWEPNYFIKKQELKVLVWKKIKSINEYLMKSGII